MLAETVQGWYDEAEAKGEARGITKGMALSLLQIMELRFGPQPESVRDQVMSLTETESMAGLQRVMNANSVTEVLFNKPASQAF